jgi:hypothetical protein
VSRGTPNDNPLQPDAWGAGKQRKTDWFSDQPDQVNPLARAITEELPWLMGDFGFRMVYFSYDPRHMGNCVVDLNGPPFRLQFVKDRGQILAYLAPLGEPENWWFLNDLLETTRGVLPEPEFKLAAVGQRLRENFSRLADALGPQLERTRVELERRKELRISARLPPVRPTKPVPGWLRSLDRFLNRISRY